jgi:hypothetical protein
MGNFPGFLLAVTRAKLARMRFPHLAVIAAAGVAIAFASLPFALAAGEPAPALVRQAVLPVVAGDDATGSPAPATGTPTASPAATFDTCAGERSPVRTLTDPAAGFSRTPAQSSIFALLALERPAVGPATPRIAPTETGVVELDVWLRGFIRRNSGAIELLVSNSPTGPVLLANFPPQGCIAKASAEDQAAMTTARIELVGRCGLPITGGMTTIAGPAKLRGVPFWGKPGDGLAGAPGGIELGPVLAFEMAEGLDCDPGTYKDGIPTPTPVPTAKSMTIGAAPLFVARGQEVQVTIYTQPATEGIACWYVAWDNAMVQMAQGETKLTGPDGTASWSFTIPLDAATGSDGRVTPYCTGISPTGSARLTILP